MHKAIKILTLLLTVQLGLVIFNNIDKLETSKEHSKTPLVAINWSQIDRLEIADQDNTIELTRKDGSQQWVLPNYFDLTVNKQKIDGLLKKLEDVPQSWPVGKTAEAQKRFDVSADNFQRRLIFKQGDEALATLYTGTSPGHRKVHARLEDSDHIYSIAMSNFEASTDAKNWFNRQLLKPNLDTINAIRLTFTDGSPSITLHKSDNRSSENAWTLQGLRENDTIRQDQIDSLLNDIKQFTVEAALASESSVNTESNNLENAEKSEKTAQFQQGDPVASVTLTHPDKTVEWLLSEPTTGGHLILKSSAHPVYFQVNRVEGEKLTLKKRDTLFTTSKPEAEVEPEAPIDIESQVLAPQPPSHELNADHELNSEDAASADEQPQQTP